MDVAQANFAVNLLRESVKDSKSTVLSPLSIHMALFMFYYGSLGKTKKEFKELLADGVETESEIVRHMEDLLQDIADSKDKNYTLRLAMRIYVKRRLPVMHGFINTLKDYYGEEVKPLNPRNPEKLAEEINSWVSNVTEQKIKDIVSVDDLRQNLQMLALNALYFKGTWMNQFSSRDTGKKLFYSSEENSREVDMMSLSSYIHHFANNQLRLIKLPYIDGVEMIVILPKKRFNLHSVLQTLSGSDLLRYIQESKPTDVSLNEI
ncbi:unnamed protein product [Thelazia callipaeda]|uniref:SERPIN domain-containing protein n=1 Tax=Thelazia callipaeda TaxID=103827 RepID=A0A0N5DBF4_THECL|nr:unnamed protein product [Thelazia callipaeda]